MTAKKRLTKEDIEKLKRALPTMPEELKRKTEAELVEYNSKLTSKVGKLKFLEFIQHVYPGYIIGEHHRRLAKIFEDIANGEKKRVIVNIAPRHGKSELISYLAQIGRAHV